MAVRHLLPASACVILLPLVMAVAAPLKVRVSGDRVCLRAAANERAEVVGQVDSGAELMAPHGVGSNDWVAVTPPQSVSLWIYSELVRDGHVAVDKAQVRGGPGLNFKRVGELARGAAVVARGSSGDWLKIAPPPAALLWIAREYVVAPLPQAAPEAANVALVATAVAPSPAEASENAALVTNLIAAAEAEALAAAVEASEQEAAIAAATVASADAAAAAAAAAAAMPPTIAATRATPWPAALSGWPPDPQRPQNIEARFEGWLLRSSRNISHPGHYDIVAASEGHGRATLLCRLIGFEGQLRSLAASRARVVARGRVWHAADQAAPLLLVETLVTLE